MYIHTCITRTPNSPPCGQLKDKIKEGEDKWGLAVFDFTLPIATRELTGWIY